MNAWLEPGVDRLNRLDISMSLVGSGEEMPLTTVSRAGIELN